MNPDLAVGFGLAAIGAALLLLNAWATYTDRKANLMVEQAIRNAADPDDLMAPEPSPQYIEWVRTQIQAEAWVMSQTPISDRLAEERFRKQLEEDGRPSWLV